MPAIHPTAIVEPGAQLAASVEIGPYCIVGAETALGEGVRLISHAVVTGRTTVADGTVVYPFASIGHRPQDLKYKGEASTLTIGRNNQIREHVTMNPGTEGGGMVTKVGDGCLFMMGAHVAHDCILGDGIILANGATLGGHVVVGDHAILGGLSAIHQFVRIGAHAMIGGMSGVENDVIPFGSVTGNRAQLAGLNLIGLKRRGFSREDIHALRAAYREIFLTTTATQSERLEQVAAEHAGCRPVMEMVAFLRAESQRGICQAKPENGA